MKKIEFKTIFELLIGGVIICFVVFSYSLVWTSAAEKPQYGGTLNHAVEGDPPSYDAHRESTFAMVHPTAPHYSLLLKMEQENYPKIVGDLAESWTVSSDRKTYTFKIHKDVKFHDGSFLTARDIKASYEKIIFPPPGIISVRKALYSVVERIEVPDENIVIFHLKWPSASFLPLMASPFNYIYKADILAKDLRWYERNIMGSGPFKFVEHVTGSHWVGKRNEDYFVKGRPFLDGFRVFFIRDTGSRLAAMRAGRVHSDFRGQFSPIQRDDVVRALGDKIRVQEQTLVMATLMLYNCREKNFDDPRVRRALTLAINRWEGLKVLSRIADASAVGGLLRPGSEFAMNEAELTQIAGFSRNIEGSRKEARRLLREAGVPEGLSFELITPPTKGYQPKAIYCIDQWRQIGLNVTQKPLDWGIFNAALREGNFKVALYAISDFMDEPDMQFIRFISSDKSPSNYGHYTDRLLDDIYVKQGRAVDPMERKKLCMQFQKRVLDEMSYAHPIVWLGRITLHSPNLKGWRALPSHVANQDLTNVWLDKD